MKTITKNLFESLTESTSGNTIKEYAMNYLDGYIDNDVTDTEIDMIVAFCFDFNETPKDSYDEFMNILGQRTKIVKVHDSEYGATLECDFSSVFKPYNEQLKEFFNMDNSEFDEDEAYYEAVDNLEPLISGNAGESTYKELNDILKSNVINEGAELKSGNDFDEVAAYMYKDASNQVEYIPSIDEMDYIADVTKSEYNKLYNAVKTAIENVEGHFYNGMIELSDRATMNSLNTIEDESKYDDANQTYAELRDRALEDFTAETGVGVWQDGRSGRHIVVEDDYYNARDYAKLCDIQEKYENKVIDEFNKKYSNEESINESEELNNHKMNSIKYKTDGYVEATDGYYKGKPIVDYREKDFKKGTSVLMPFICSNCYNEFYVKSNIHDFFEQGDFDDPYETPKDDLRCPKCKERDIDYNGEVLIKEPGVKENINESEDLAIYTDFSNFPNEVSKGETPEERKNIFYRCYVANPKEDEMHKWTIKDLVEYIKETDEYYNKDYKYIFKCCLLCGLTKEEAKELCGEKLNEDVEDKNIGIRKKQLEDNIYDIICLYDNGINDGVEGYEPFKSEKDLVDYVYSQVFDQKSDGDGSTIYGNGICRDLKYLGKDYIVSEIIRIGNEIGVVNTKLTESVDEGSLSKFIKDSVEKLQNSDYTNCKYNLDDKYAVFVGWSDGYEAEETNEYEIHSKENPTYCINAAIGIRNDADWADFDSIKRPYYEGGDVFEGEWTVSSHEDYSYLANSILKTYYYMLDLINSGELLTEGTKNKDLNKIADKLVKLCWDGTYHDAHTEIVGVLDNIKYYDGEFPEFKVYKDYNLTSKEFDKLYDLLYDKVTKLLKEGVNKKYNESSDNINNYIYYNAESEDKSDAESMINTQYRDKFPNLTFKIHTDGTMWYVDFIGKYQDICDALINLGWYNEEEINKMTDNGLIKPYKINESNSPFYDPAIDEDPDLNREQVNADVNYWTEVDEANTEDVSNMEPIGVYGISNTGAIYVYKIEHDIDDRVLVGDNSDTTKARWTNINYDDLVDEETGEPIPFFYYGDIKVPLNEVMRTDM